jgi:BASS family bile acid:Na+ symporter
VLVVAAIPVLIALFPAIISLVGNGTILAFAAFVVVALAVGHFLGGPDPDERTVLALASASRHPAVAIAIAHANFPDEKLAVWRSLLRVHEG